MGLIRWRFIAILRLTCKILKFATISIRHKIRGKRSNIKQSLTMSYVWASKFKPCYFAYSRQEWKNFRKELQEKNLSAEHYGLLGAVGGFAVHKVCEQFFLQQLCVYCKFQEKKDNIEIRQGILLQCRWVRSTGKASIVKMGGKRIV